MWWPGPGVWITVHGRQSQFYVQRVVRGDSVKDDTLVGSRVSFTARTNLKEICSSVYASAGILKVHVTGCKVQININTAQHLPFSLLHNPTAGS